MINIKRDKYLQRLIDRQNNGMIKVITGIRRCGKSYLLFNIFYEYLIESGVDPSKIITVQLDDDTYKELRDPENLNNFIRSQITDEGQWYVMLDEIQMCKGFEGILNGLLYKENVDVYVTGSNSKFLSSDIITEFRGRGDQVRVWPLSFFEFSSAFSGDKYEAWANYITFGGLPRLLSLNSNELKNNYLLNLSQELYLKDIENRYNMRGNSYMSELLNVLASSIGSLTNPTKLSNTFTSKGKTISNKTVSLYIDYLIDAFFINKVERYDVKGKHYIGSPYKYYFTDIGLRNAQINFRQIEENHIMENIIYNELRYRGLNVDVGMVEHFQKNKSGDRQRKNLEVDFVCNLASQRYYIQSALSIPDKEKMEQEQKSLINIDDSFKKIIIVKDPTITWRNEKGITIMSVFDFLLNSNSLDV